MLKTFLKNARQALGEKDNAYCISQCQSALEIDDQSYTAYVFLGLAHTNLDEFGTAEDNYRRAIALDKKNLLAWQGLAGLHEKAGKMTEYIDDSSRVAALYAENSQVDKCRGTVEKCVAYARENGTSSELSQALRLILPVSPFFRLLESDLPPAADTYLELSKLLEDQEAADISSAVAKGRTRLGVRLDQLTAEVKRNTMADSPLENIYEEIINWSHEEQVRRDAEAKLLARVATLLEVARPSEKGLLLGKCLHIARGMTIVKVPNARAWRIALEWTDLAIGNFDLEFLAQYISLFAESSLSKALAKYIRSVISPYEDEQLAHVLSSDELDKDNRRKERPISVMEVINAMQDAREDDCQESHICLNILTQLHCAERDWASAAEAAEAGLRCLDLITTTTSATLPVPRAELEYHLSLALTFHRSPRFHAKASDLLDRVLLTSCSAIRQKAQVAKARLLRLQNQNTASENVLEALLKEAPETEDAILEMAFCKNGQNQFEEALTLLLRLSEHPERLSSKEIAASVYYNIGLCQKHLEHSSAEIYASFIQALRYDPAHAPTYTALGLYYADTVKDNRRAEKCFQKALELSSAELVAAERLAASFADDGDWELVQIIAQRVIHGNELIRVSWPHRAIGFVQLHTGKHQLAVTSFQASLRLDSKDVDAWLGLGEAYLELGKYQAAEKAFTRASLHDPANWYAQYLSSTVHLALGDFQKACGLLTTLYEQDKTSLSLRLSLASGHLSWAKSLLTTGWTSKGLSQLTQALSLVGTIEAKDQSVITLTLLGKATGLIASYWQSSTGTDQNLEKLEKLLQDCSPKNDFLPPLAPDASEKSRYALLSAQAHLCCLDLPSNDQDAEANIWFEIGHALSIAATTVQEESEYSGKAIQAFQAAVKLDSNNDVYWAALSTVTMRTDPEFGHHCMIKAVTLAPKSTIHWTNLGYFYLKMDHLEAANKAFMTAQQLDPTFALAWLGQALLAQTLGESDHELFEHAFRLGLPTERPLLSIELTRSMLSNRKDVALTPNELQNGLWALKQAEKPSTDQKMSLVITFARALLLEHWSEDHQPKGDATQLADLLEDAYEEDESPETLQRYCEAKAVLARCHLRQGGFEDAIETASSVIELEPANCPETLKSCSLVLGIANLRMNQAEEAISAVQELYEQSGGNDLDVLAILVQILASTGEQSHREVALDLLERSHDSPRLKLLYTALVATNEDASTKQRSRAALLLAELTPSTDAVITHDRKLVERVLSRGPYEETLLGQVHASPEDATLWSALASQTTDLDARRHLQVLARETADRGSLDVRALADIHLRSAALEMKLVGLHLQPDALV